MSLSCCAIINKQKKYVFLTFAATMNCTVSAMAYVCMDVGLKEWAQKKAVCPGGPVLCGYTCIFNYLIGQRSMDSVNVIRFKHLFVCHKASSNVSCCL